MKCSLSLAENIGPNRPEIANGVGSHRKPGRLVAVTALTGLLILSFGRTANAQLITFDDVTLSTDTRNLRETQDSSYKGLFWSNLFILDTTSEFQQKGLNGYTHSAVSGSDVGVNAGGNPLALTSPVPFTLDGLYLTSAWNNGLNVTINAYNNNNTLIDTTTEIVGVSGPTHFLFDWSGISSLKFVASKGTPDPDFVGQGAGEEFALDNLLISQGGSPVPEPGVCALLAGAVLAGTAVLRRKRRLR